MSLVMSFRSSIRPNSQAEWWEDPDIGYICFFIAFSIKGVYGGSKNTKLPLSKFGQIFLLPLKVFVNFEPRIMA